VDTLSPKAREFTGLSTERCTVWNGSGRGEIDADNWWCPVYYNKPKGLGERLLFDAS
jgi:hypothetical protein